MSVQELPQCVCRLRLAKCLQKPQGVAPLHAELAAGGETEAATAVLIVAIKHHRVLSGHVCLRVFALCLQADTGQVPPEAGRHGCSAC